MPETIGDVKYSILEPGIFMDLNPGWELLVKKTIEPISPLGKIGITELPDGRGVFIRSMNENRDPAEGDADSNRPIGQYQPDQFREHNHAVNPPDNFMDNDTGPNGCEGGSDVNYGRRSITTANVGGNETRPRNIALYLYVKIM